MTAAGDGAGGAGGSWSEVDAGGAGGRGGEQLAGGRGGDLGGAGGASSGGAGGRACLDQVDANAPGFAFGPGCNGEPPSSPDACHAACELAGAHFVGCVSGSAIATVCYSSCASCP